MQHGHMDQVGYDTYCKLLDEVVKEMNGIEIQEEFDVQIDINVSSFIPDEFIPESSQKIDIYQKIALCRTEEDILNVTDEIIDRYGKMPQEVEKLLNIARIKEMCKQKNVLKISQNRENIVFYFEPSKFNIDKVDELVEKYRNRVKFSASQKPYVTYKLLKNGSEIEEIKELLTNI